MATTPMPTKATTTMAWAATGNTPTSIEDDLPGLPKVPPLPVKPWLGPERGFICLGAVLAAAVPRLGFPQPHFCILHY